MRVERGKPDRSHKDGGKSPARVTGERAGKGCRRKPMPVCNGPDRGSNVAPARKGAHFRQVLDHENGTEKLNLRGNFRR